MTGNDDELDEAAVARIEHEIEAHEMSRRGIAEANAHHLKRYRDFRLAADWIAATWSGHREVEAVALIGSVAQAPFREVPRHNPYRRARIELWHECSNVDLALWVSGLDGLGALRQSKSRTLTEFHKAIGTGVASHQIDVFILEPGTDRYLGRLCDFRTCPKGKIDCLVPGCGASRHLRQYQGFVWRPESVAPDRAVELFDRATGRRRLAADLALPGDG